MAGLSTSLECAASGWEAAVPRRAQLRNRQLVATGQLRLLCIEQGSLPKRQSRTARQPIWNLSIRSSPPHPPAPAAEAVEELCAI